MKFGYFILSLLLLIVALPALGAADYLGGQSGVIITPDDVILPVRDWELSFHDILGVLPDNDNLLAGGLTYGLAKNLEVGASYVTNSGNSLVANGKYRMIEETQKHPGVIVGVFDIAGTADIISGTPNFYILLTKKLFPPTAYIGCKQTSSLKGSIGFGSGLYNGLIANLTWTVDPRFDLLLEYNGGDGGEGDLAHSINIGGRWAATDSLKLDAAAVDFQDFGFGVSYISKFN